MMRFLGQSLLFLLLAPLLAGQLRWQPRPDFTGRFHAASTYWPDTGQSVVFGGAVSSLMLNDTWVWNGRTWEFRRTTRAPLPRWYSAMTYDPVGKTPILFGGVSIFGGKILFHGDTWRFDGRNWTQLSPATSPSPREGAAMAYDPRRKRVVLFGGAVPFRQLFADTWEWDGRTWTNRVSKTVPPARLGHVMAYHPKRGRIVMFGARPSAAT